MIDFNVQPKKSTSFPHYWEQCVGSCHAYTALRADYRQQLKKAHDEIGFEYVRFHGLFDDDMSVCIEKKDWNDNSLGIVYNFANIDNIIDFLLEIDMKPFFELGFMPTCLASGEKTVFHYQSNITLPKSDQVWQELINAFIEHILTRYGKKEVEQWFFEVWNEPNLAFFFDGTQADYFHLYEITARTIKKLDSKLQVGGPATSINAWIPEMIEFCEQNQVPLDFVSTHHYPTDDPLWESGLNTEDFFKQNGAQELKYPRGVLQKMTQQTNQEAKQYPLYYTEWNVSALVGDAIHDQPYAAAMVAKTLADNDGLVNGYSFWTFTDIFEENAQIPGVFHGGFGLQTYNGIAKPTYRIFQLFHQLGQQRLAVATNSSKNSTVELLAVRKNNDLQLMIYNHNTVDQPIQAEDITITLNDTKSDSFTGTKIQIDEQHSNPYKIWQQWGQPTYINQEELTTLKVASQLSMEPFTAQNSQITLTIDPHACVLICLNNFFQK